MVINSAAYGPFFGDVFASLIFLVVGGPAGSDDDVRGCVD